MKSFLLSAILSTVLCISVSASGATWYVDGSVSSSGDGTTWETAVKTIQEGVNLAGHQDTVFVAPGTYSGDGNTEIHLDGKRLSLESRDGASATAIDCEGSGRGFDLQGSGETEESVIRGFTIKNGNYAVFCIGSSPTVRECVLSRNNDAGVSCHPEGLTPQGEVISPSDVQIIDCLVCENSAGVEAWSSNPTITGSRISQNYARGIRAMLASPTITACTISGNQGQSGAGLYMDKGMDGVYPIVEDCLITDNVAEQDGGGICLSERIGTPHVTIKRCVVAGNSAKRGGGIFSYQSFPDLWSCVIARNQAEHGAGIYLGISTPRITNCTIVENVHGGGVDCAETSNPRIVNCIVYANYPQQIYGNPSPRYCNIEGGWPGAGNISADPFPFFQKPKEANYRLHPDSPCVDAGTQNPDVVELPETDIGGMHRIMYGGKALTVDIGAYEFHIWPPTENVETGEMTLKWSSLAGIAYTIYCSGDMFTWDVLADDVASAGDTFTTWVDPPAPVLPPGVPRRYYKIAENPLLTPSAR